MQISTRLALFSLIAPAIIITGCASSLPELPRELEVEPVVNQPVQSAPSATSAPPPTPPTPPTPPPPSPSSVVTLPETTPEVTDAGIRVLHKASYNPFDRDNGKSFRALTTMEIYRTELGRHSIETVKPVDFSSSQVLVSSIGEKPTGGYTVSATNIEEFDDIIVVTVVQTIPGPACINTQGATHPFEFVVVPSRKPIEIFERQRINEC